MTKSIEQVRAGLSAKIAELKSIGGERKDAYSFHLVWSPDGKSPPSHRHNSEASARAEAGRLARANPGKSFFVLEAIAEAQVNEPVRWTELVRTDDIPF
ncbi:hypothetical protein [Terrarubrum flagellatum]|uniref:hypothetical protein n=1 Tax=Terrirubrum flagellatum TaxID=2895980 RepID=UPI0031450E6D